MPQVPTYDGPQVGARGLSFDQANADAFGGAQAKQLTALGAGVEKAAEAIDRINEREVRTQVFDAEAKAKSAYVAWSQDAVKTRQGEAAKGLTKDASDWWNKAVQDYGQNLSPMAQRMLQRSAAQQALVAQQSMGQFENTQLDAAQTVALKATTSASRDSAVSDSSDKNIAVQRQNILGAWETQRGKYDAQTFDQLVKGELTQMHVAVFNKLLVDNPSQAKLYYEVNQKEITGQVKDEILSRLKQGVAIEEGGSAARTAFTEAMAGKGYNDAIPYDAMDAKLVKQFEHEPEKLKAARAELDRQVNLRNKAQSEYNAGAIEGVFGLLNKGQPLSTVMRTAEWSALSEQNKRQITQQIDDRNHMLWARNIEDKNRLRMEQELRTAPALLQYSQPENLANLTRAQIIEMMPEIGVHNTERLLNYWQTYQGNQAKLSQATVDNDAFNSVLAGVGIDPKPRPNDKEGALRVLNLRNQVEITIGRMQSEGAKREFTATEKMRVMQDIANAEVLRPGFWSSNYTKTERVSNLKPDQLLTSAVRITDTNGKAVVQPLAAIPLGEYADTERYLIRKGITPTPAAVAQRWYEFKNPKKVTP